MTLQKNCPTPIGDMNKSDRTTFINMCKLVYEKGKDFITSQYPEEAADGNYFLVNMSEVCEKMFDKTIVQFAIETGQIEALTDPDAIEACKFAFYMTIGAGLCLEAQNA